MKQVVLSMIVILLFIACGSNNNETVRNFVPGLYVKEIRQEYAIGMDSILITLMDRQASSYEILRKTYYQQMIDGRKLNPQREVHKWIAYYDASKHQLIEPNNERVFTFLPDHNMLLMGSSRYLKVNANSPLK